MVWLSLVLVVVGLAFVLRGALLSGPGPIRFPTRFIRRPSRRAGLMIAGVAVVAVLGTAAVNVDRSQPPVESRQIAAPQRDLGHKQVTLELAPPEEGGGAAPEAAAPDASARRASPRSASEPVQPIRALGIDDDDDDDAEAAEPGAAPADEEPSPEPEDDEDKDGKGDRSGPGRGEPDEHSAHHRDKSGDN
jgi:hypothetical protein